MSAFYFFIGPYIECRSLQDVWPQDSQLTDAWSDLLNDQQRMEWNMPLGNPRTITVDGTEWFQYCGVPIEPRAGVPRWPMLFRFSEPQSDSQNFDWSDVDTGAEVAWFKKAYARELALLSSLFSVPPELRWGGVYWPR